MEGEAGSPQITGVSITQFQGMVMRRPFTDDPFLLPRSMK